MRRLPDQGGFLCAGCLIRKVLERVEKEASERMRRALASSQETRAEKEDAEARAAKELYSASMSLVGSPAAEWSPPRRTCEGEG